MIDDGKPAHWPKMLATPAGGSQEQAAVRALAEARRLIVAYRKNDDPEDWRTDHAQTDYIVNVVAGLIADADAIDALHLAADRQVTPLRERIKELEEALAESKRPFTAQMEMQNKRIIGLNAEIERLTEVARLSTRTEELRTNAANPERRSSLELSEVKPDGASERVGEESSCSGEVGRRDAILTGGAERGARAANQGVRREEGLTEDGAGAATTTPSPLVRHEEPKA